MWSSRLRQSCKLFCHSRLTTVSCVALSKSCALLFSSQVNCRCLSTSPRVFDSEEFGKSNNPFTHLKSNFEDEAIDENVNNVYSWIAQMADREETGDSWQRVRNLQATGHNHVLVIQPFRRHQDEKGRVQLRLEESVTLVRTLNWTVAHSLAAGRSMARGREMPFGVVQVQNLNALANSVNASAVFVSINSLSPLERVHLEMAFEGRPVFDRFSLVLQIFKRHAKSGEAKLQLSLAEIPYLLRRMEEERDPTRLVTGRTLKNDKNKDFYERRLMAVKTATNAIKAKLKELKKSRQVMREKRQRTRIPTVAVVGYTNGGKTSLIRALSQDERVVPADKLFATLDVSSHKAFLPSTKMEVLLIDTVGFISDLPPELMASFSATLEDMLEADLVVHVRDLSHPDTEEQSRTVLETLKRLQLPAKLLDNILTVGNKVDLIDPKALEKVNIGQFMPISATKGLGMRQFASELEQTLIDITGRELKTFRCQIHSHYYRWLRSNVDVIQVDVDEERPDHVLVKTLLKPGDLSRFHKNCDAYEDAV